jgi:cobalamin-dependent methionine synthase I
MTAEFPDPEIHRLLGNGSGAPLNAKTAKKITFWTRCLERLVRPELVYSIHPLVQVGNSTFSLPKGIEFISAKMAGAFRNCDFVLCFAATLGPKIQAEIDRLTGNSNLADACIVDAIGSVGAEQIVERFHRHMERNMRRNGRSVSLRFSPGYCDWSLEEQAKLFKVIETRRIGIDLSDSYLMIPSKSVSGMFGIEHTPSSAFTSPKNPCLDCGMANCTANRATHLQ